MSTRRSVGRPALAWLPAASSLAGLPVGTAVVLDVGRHPRVRGRLIGVVADEVLLETATGTKVVAMAGVARARVVVGVFEPGDPVLRKDVPESEWRGGVVRTKGTDVLVETLADGFVWIAETELESPDARFDPPWEVQ